MSTLLHYLPYLIFSGLIALALVPLFAHDSEKRRMRPQRIRRQHYVWHEDDVRSAKRF